MFVREPKTLRSSPWNQNIFLIKMFLLFCIFKKTRRNNFAVQRGKKSRFRLAEFSVLKRMICLTFCGKMLKTRHCDRPTRVWSARTFGAVRVWGGGQYRRMIDTETSRISVFHSISTLQRCFPEFKIVFSETSRVKSVMLHGSHHRTTTALDR